MKRNLKEYERILVEHWINHTDPTRLQPHYKQMWLSICSQYQESKYLSEKQLKILRVCHSVSQNIKLGSSDRYDINDKLNVILNPMKSF